MTLRQTSSDSDDRTQSLTGILTESDSHMPPPVWDSERKHRAAARWPRWAAARGAWRGRLMSSGSEASRGASVHVSKRSGPAVALVCWPGPRWFLHLVRLLPRAPHTLPKWRRPRSTSGAPLGEASRVSAKQARKILLLVVVRNAGRFSQRCTT